MAKIKITPVRFFNGPDHYTIANAVAESDKSLLVPIRIFTGNKFRALTRGACVTYDGTIQSLIDKVKG